jgi:hypothetical protein
MFDCNNCEFATKYKSNYLRHIKICCIESLFSCKYCDTCYKTQTGINNHKDKCLKRDNYELKLEIELDSAYVKIDDLKLELSELKTQLYADRKDLNEIAKNASVQVTNNSINVASESALKYITKHFPNAPVLERKDIPKLIEYDNSKEPEKDKLAEEWICAEKTGSLVPFIGKIIVNLYKPDDPAFQPVWNSDVERLTFYRRVLNDKKVSTWVTDKKGIDTCSEIIKPMLEHIEQQLIAYNNKHPTPEEIQKFGQLIMEHVEVSHKIITKIKDGQLETSVLKYCAPHFSINKTKDNIKVKQIKFSKKQVKTKN